MPHWCRPPVRLSSRRRRAGAFAALCLVLTAAAPCGTVVLPTGLGAETTAEPVYSLHPLLGDNSLFDFEVFPQLYRPLLWIAPDLTISASESEASRIEVLENNTLFRIHLKPWLWSDGVPVTADDLQFCFELIRQLGPAFYGWNSDGMPDLFRSVRATAPNVLEIRTPHPVNPDWFETLAIAGVFNALPRHLWGRYDAEAQRGLSGDPRFFAVSDGPFVLEHYSVGRFVALRPNPRWSGHQPEMARLVIDFLAGVDPLEALQAGEIDAATIPFGLRRIVAALPGLSIVQLPAGPIINGMSFNLANPAVGFLRDLRVREAIADAVDQQAIIDVVFRGHAAKTYGPVPPTDAGYLSPAAAAGHFPVGYDPAHARELLRQAGYAPGPDGVLQKQGVRLAMTQLVAANLPDTLLVAEFVQSSLAHIGIQMQLRQMDFNQLLALAYRSPDGWETSAIGTSYPAYPDLGANFASAAPQNFSHFKDPVADALLTRLTTEPGREALFAAQDRIAAQVPALFLPQGAYAILTAKGVTGWEAAIQSNFLWRLEYLHLTSDRLCK